MHHDGTRTVGGTRLTDDLVGYEVEGRDGHLGRIAGVTPDGAHALVTTGRIRSRAFSVAASQVRLIDPESEAILVDVARDEAVRLARSGTQHGFRSEFEDAVRSYYTALRAGRSR